MKRRPSIQDLTWLLDLFDNKQLNLSPPYQRRSVWTRGDKQFFLDTIFRNYPCPAIFLHKTISDSGKATYHLVDGKQRTETILEFVGDKLKIGDFGDTRLDGKKWSELQGETELKQQFWNYQLTVEMLDTVDGVNEVFDRLNRNARKLTRQELRHARFEGWFIATTEAEAGREEWATLGVATKARAKRMADTQFLSELMLVVLDQSVQGFDQDAIDEKYRDYDDPDDPVDGFDPDVELSDFNEVKDYLLQLEAVEKTVTTYAKTLGNFYTLWSVIALADSVPVPADFAPRYRAFMEGVAALGADPYDQAVVDAFAAELATPDVQLLRTYRENSRGASTDLGPRQARHEALRQAVIG